MARLILNSFPLILFTVLFLIGCKKEDQPEVPVYEEYIIPEGKHYSTEKVRIHRGNRLKFLVKFDSTAVYSCKDPVNQFSINKLLGFSDCDSRHHDNSARIGWRWLENRLEIHAYYYTGKTRSDVYITSVELGKAYECSIEIEEDAYLFTVDGKSFRGERNCSHTNFKYYLFPYFGGTEVSPHDIKIKIAELKKG